MLTCTACGLSLAQPCRRCPNCGQEAGCPSHLVYAEEDRPYLHRRFRSRQSSHKNYRHRMRRRRLHQRVRSRRSSHGSTNSTWRKLLTLRQRITEAMRVSINMRPESLINLLSDPRTAYVNLHGNRLAGAVVDPNRYKDNKRLAFDLLAFGPDGEKIRFGALSLGGPGLFSYGTACVILKHEEALNRRISFLEENSFSYFQNDPPGVRVEVPVGVRALWPDAPTLAVLKHERDLVNQRRWSLEQLGDLILHCEGDKRTDRYIEAQIGPPLTLENIEKIAYIPDAYSSRGTGTGREGEMAEHSRDLAEWLSSSARLARIEFEVISDAHTGGTPSDR